MAKKKVVGIAKPSISHPPVRDMGRVVEVPHHEQFAAAHRRKPSAVRGSKR